MRKRKLTFGLFSLMMAASVALTGNVNVSAATKKLSVNRVYENATVIKGKTQKKNVVKVKVGGKTYSVKANKKGKFKVKVPKVKAGKKKLTVTWKKDKNVSGYQIKIATKKNFKGAKTYTVKSYKTYKKVIKKLKANKKYFVKVRAYKTVGKSKVYGAYSAVRSCKVK